MSPILKPAAAAALLACTMSAATLPAQAQGAAACTDFDAHVNGRWLAQAVLPAERSRVGSFDTLRVGNAQLLQTALAELAADPARQSTPGLALLATYYRSGSDEAAIEARGLAPVAPLLASISALTRESLPALIGELARVQIAAPLALFVGADAKDATRNVLNIVQAGLGLPDREDYFRSDADARRVTQAYRAHAARLLQAASAPADDTTVDALMAFETQLARAAPQREQRRDPNASYNPTTPAGLQALAPGLAWAAWLAAYGAAADSAPLVVGQPGFTKAVAELAQSAPLETWRAYLRVRLLDATAEHLPRALAQSHFAYRGTAVRGLAAPLPRAEQLIGAIGGNNGGAPLAESLGELYAARAFSPLAQQRAQQMLVDIKAAMRERIARLPWMSEPTKQLARAKLENMVAKIGMPERWRSYDGLVLDGGDFAGNLLRVNAWNTAQRLADLSRPVDRARWNTSPYVVNAFAAGGNQIVFPAGILQPPFFDAAADDATNYGAIGMVIGHEITHHFDDRGRQFDAVGNLRDWWLPADAAAYKERASRVAALYSGFEPVPGVRINGQLTLGENISDFGGAQLAYDALQIALTRQRAAGQRAPLIDGQTPEQRFFTANALIWRSKMRPEALVDLLRTDSHSPGRWRVLAPMSNMPAFAQAFGCKAGDAMVAGEPITIW